MNVFEIYGQQIMWFSLLANVFVFVILFVSGIGKRLLQRMRQRILHKRGGWVNSIMVSKNGTAQEVFKKTDDDHSLVVGKDKYVVDRSKTVLFDGIPTMMHYQGFAEPVAWNDPEGSMSTGELQQIIENNKKEDIIALLKQYLPIVIVITVVVVILAGGSIYLNWQIYDKLVQETAVAIVSR